MVLNLIQEIGDYIKNQIPFFDNYGVNAIKTADNRIINFTDNQEKKQIGIDDCYGNYFYIRFDPNITFAEPQRRFSSCEAKFQATAKCRIVALSFTNVVSSDKLTDMLIRNLKSFSSTNVFARPKIILRKQNFNYSDVFNEEAAQRLTSGVEFTAIYIDFDILYYQDSNNCEPCNIDIEKEC